MEKEIEVKTFKVNYICDECKYGGIMQPSGNALLTDPMLYPHKCNNCGFKRNFKCIYPKVIIRNVQIMKIPTELYLAGIKLNIE